MKEGEDWSQLLARRLTRRRVLRATLLGGAGLAGIAIVGCGGKEATKEGTIEPTLGPEGDPDRADPKSNSPRLNPAWRESAGPSLSHRGNSLRHVCTTAWCGTMPRVECISLAAAPRAYLSTTCGP